MVRSSHLPVLLCSALLCTGCGGGDGPATPEPDDDAVASVTVSPTSATLVRMQSVQLDATARTASGATITGRTVGWSAQPTGVVDVDDTGQVTGTAPGTATVQATVEGRSATATVMVVDGGFVGPAGGLVVAVSGRVEIDVPAGAVSEGTALTAAPNPSPPSHPDLVPGSAVDLGPNGITFAQPVTVRLQWADGELPAGVEAEYLVVHRHDGSGWTPLADASVAPSARSAEGTTSAFSPFALIEVVPNPVPTLDALYPAEAAAGSQGFPLTVLGDGFVESSEVLWNGELRATTYLAADQLLAQISADDIAQSGQVQVTVRSPEPGGGTSEARVFVIAEPPPPAPRAIAAGGDFSCVVSSTGVASCWGSGSDGRLGNGSTADHSTPVEVAGDHDFATLALGLEHACALDGSGAAHCWGEGQDGRLGNGSTADRTTPTPVSGSLELATIDAGTGHTCAVATDEVGYCWGRGDDGILGTGSVTDQFMPTAVAGGHAFATISVGNVHTCGLTTDGQALCWGVGTSGELGDGASTNSPVPVVVAGGHTFTAITAGNRHTCGITDEGTALCWGLGDSGRLGHGSSTLSGTPVEVVGGRTMTSIAAYGLGGNAHTCAIETEGAAYCWGQGDAGQLGIGLFGVSRDGPVMVVGAHLFLGIAVGVSHTCGIRVDGALFCWGDGGSGRLGDGGTVNRAGPVRVVGS